MFPSILIAGAISAGERTLVRTDPATARPLIQTVMPFLVVHMGLNLATMLALFCFLGDLALATGVEDFPAVRLVVLMSVSHLGLL
jgi:hypothetical protein